MTEWYVVLCTSNWGDLRVATTKLFADREEAFQFAKELPASRNACVVKVQDV